MSWGEEAGPGQVFVCGCCGRTAYNRGDLGDIACMQWAVLCYVDSLQKDEIGQVVRARAVPREPVRGDTP